MPQKEDRLDFSNREYRNSAFATYFSDPNRAAELFRALDHDMSIEPEDIHFTTLKGVLFMARKNDLAFTAGAKVLVISEHQSTINLNMPLRDAIYFGRTMELLIPSRNIYKTKRLSIPTPEFYTFYNGIKEQPQEQILKLSDSFLEKTEEPMLELKVKVININLSAEHPILKQSRSMYEYSWFIQRIQEYLSEQRGREYAIRAAMEDCRRAGILTDFIAEHGSEVMNMLFTEFNMEDALEVRGEERYEDGLEDGKKMGVELGIAQGMEQGMEQGRAQGVEQGAAYQLIAMVCRKMEKGKTPESIAEELDEDIAVIRPVYEAAKACGPDHDCGRIYGELLKKGL